MLDWLRNLAGRMFGRNPASAAPDAAIAGGTGSNPRTMPSARTEGDHWRNIRNQINHEAAESHWRQVGENVNREAAQIEASRIASSATAAAERPGFFARMGTRIRNAFRRGGEHTPVAPRPTTPIIDDSLRQVRDSSGVALNNHGEVRQWLNPERGSEAYNQLQRDHWNGVNSAVNGEAAQIEASRIPSGAAAAAERPGFFARLMNRFRRGEGTHSYRGTAYTPTTSAAAAPILAELVPEAELAARRAAATVPQNQTLFPFMNEAAAPAAAAVHTPAAVRPAMDMEALARTSIPPSAPASSSAPAAAARRRGFFSRFFGGGGGGREAAHDATHAVGEAVRDRVTGGLEAVRDKGGTLIDHFHHGARTGDGILAHTASKAGTAIGWAEVGAKPVKSMFGWGKKITGKGFKYGGIGAAALAGIGALSYLSSQSRKNREFDPRTEPLPETPASDMPQVLTAAALNGDAAPARMQREVLGPHTAKVLGRTSNGLDTSAPNTVGSDGASLIDGKPVKDLGSSVPSMS